MESAFTEACCSVYETRVSSVLYGNEHAANGQKSLQTVKIENVEKSTFAVVRSIIILAKVWLLWPTMLTSIFPARRCMHLPQKQHTARPDKTLPRTSAIPVQFTYEGSLQTCTPAAAAEAALQLLPASCLASFCLLPSFTRSIRAVYALAVQCAGLQAPLNNYAGART